MPVISGQLGSLDVLEELPLGGWRGAQKSDSLLYQQSHSTSSSVLPILYLRIFDIKVSFEKWVPFPLKKFVLTITSNNCSISREEIWTYSQQLDLINIYTTLHQEAAKYTFFLSEHGTFTKTPNSGP